MSIAVAVLTLVLLAAVIAVVSGPLLTARTPQDTPHDGVQADKPTESEAPRREELEAAREAKYREIRDAELDYHTGKLSREDFEAINGTLRAEAVEILNRLEALEGEGDLAGEGRDRGGEGEDRGGEGSGEQTGESESPSPAAGAGERRETSAGEHHPSGRSPGEENPISRVP